MTISPKFFIIFKKKKKGKEIQSQIFYFRSEIFHFPKASLISEIQCQVISTKEKFYIFQESRE